MVKQKTFELLLPDGTLDWRGAQELLAENKTTQEVRALEEALALVLSYGETVLTPLEVPCLKQGLSMALLLADLGLDTPTIIAALIFDTYVNAKIPLKEIEKKCGLEVATLILNVEKMHSVNVEQGLQQAENLRRLLLAVVEDVRGVLIRLAKHTIELREVLHCNQTVRERYAKEAQDLYAPLANRLGVGQIKWELEDLAFRILESKAYKQIATLLDERRINRDLYIEKVVSTIQRALKAENISANVFGRAKHIYSIWKKMHRKGIPYNEIYDVHGVRIIVADIRECYAALGVVHGLWQHVPKEFDDYIANPKDNGYRSLHTAVIGPDGKTLEIQIRTEEMHKQAELGVAAHWRYKEGVSKDTQYETKLANLRQILHWQEEWGRDSNFDEALKQEVFQDRVYVITPLGRVIDLPKTATVLDFAYTVHTDIGHRCRGAKVNGRMVHLTHVLKSGDQVEIITPKTGGPSRDWLNPELGYLNTVRARTKVLHWFRRQDRELNITQGRELLEKELKRLSVDKLSFDALAQQLKIAKAEDMLAALGSGDLRIHQILSAVQILAKPLSLKPIDEPRTLLKVSRLAPAKTRGADIVVAGIGNLLCNMARCCKPVPRDEIIGYITQGRGVSVHRRDCVNILHAKETSMARFIQVDWREKIAQQYLVDIKIRAYDRSLLLRDISAVLGSEKANVVDIKMDRKSEDNIVEFYLAVEISNIEALGRLLSRLQHISNVFEARRLRS